MEYPYWLDDCEHGERFEYCAQEIAIDPEEIEYILEALDGIVADVRQNSVDFGYSGEGGESSVWRGLEYSFPATSDYDVYATDETVEVEIANHAKPERRVYTVVSSWCISGADYKSTAVQRIYTLEVYPGGSSQYTVTELDPRVEVAELLIEAKKDVMPTSRLKYFDRPMVGYDVTELAKLLHRILDVALADPDYVDDESYVGWTKSA